MMKITKIGKPSELAEAFLQHIQQSGSLALQNSDHEILVVNYLEPLMKNDLIAIQQILEKKSALMFFENIRQEQFPENCLFTTDADICILKSDYHGRRQHLLIHGAKEQPNVAPLKHPQDREYRTEIDPKDAKSKSRTNDSFDTPLESNTGFDLPHVTRWLQKIEVQADADIPLVNASLIRGSITMQSHNYTSNLSGQATSCSMYYSYNVEVSAVIAPRKKKIIKLSSIGSYVSITDGLSKNSNDDRGDGTFEGNMILYPGTKATFDKSEIVLPKGWRILKIAPETPNNHNQYTHTTGWSIGAENAGEISKNPKIAAKLSLTYNESSSHTSSFHDFTALNNSTAVYCDWKYVYTKVHRDPESIFSTWIKDIENFPDLAKSTMYLKNEVLYEAPHDDNCNQMFRTFMGHQSLYAHSHSNWGVIKYGVKYQWAKYHWDYFSLNLSTVIFP